MALPTNTPLAGEIWHLSIEDLFAPVQERQRLGGDGPFVINLSVSTAPITIPTKTFDGFQDAHVYLIQVTEDGRMRYRLRLGPFASEDDADAILEEVRDIYPGALTATAIPADLRTIATMQAKLESMRASAKRAAERLVEEITIDLPPAPATLIPTVDEEPMDLEKLLHAAASATMTSPPKAARSVAQAPKVETAPPPKAEVVSPPKAASMPVVELPIELSPEWAIPVLNTRVAPVKEARPAADPAPVITKSPDTLSIWADKAPASALKPAAPIAWSASIPMLATPIPAAPRTTAAQPNPLASAAATSAAPVLTEVVETRSVATAPAPPPAVSAPVKNVPPSPPRRATAPVTRAIPAVVTAASASSPLMTSRGVTMPAATAKPPLPAAAPATPARVAPPAPPVVAVATVPAPRQVKQLDEPLESLEFTQTVRALTPPELEEETLRWYVIQLALSDHAFDPDAVPNLDIFSEYRLYSVAGMDQGRAVHALRLGFFSEEIGAGAVASYLAAYYEKPTIRRVSVAERQRFMHQRVEARKDVGATGAHAVIEITNELVARYRRTPAATATPESSQTGNRWVPSPR